MCKKPPNITQHCNQLIISSWQADPPGAAQLQGDIERRSSSDVKTDSDEASGHLAEREKNSQKEMEIQETFGLNRMNQYAVRT